MEELLRMIGEVVTLLGGFWLLIKTAKGFVIDIILKSGKRISLKVEDEEA